jgi:hypothetical protein
MSIMSFIRRYPRSLAALAVLSLAATGLSLGSGYEATAALKANFQARDATKYPSDPNLAPYGLRNIVVAYEPSLWPSGADRSQPNLSYVANTYIPRIKRQNPDVVVLDVEESDWKFTTDLSSAQITDRINKYKKLISVFRTHLPNTKIGLYLALPQRNWLAVCGDPGKRAARYTAWHNLNLKLKPLGSAVDIIFPSVYAFYDDAKSISCYPAYAKANIKEARIYGKPVWAFVWMKYHSNGRWVSRSAFRTHLETAYAAADGLVVWSKAKNSVAWSWSAPWWLETKDFLADKRLN